MRRLFARLTAALLAATALAGCGGARPTEGAPTPTQPTRPPATAWQPAPALAVRGHQLVTTDGTPVRLRGMNRSGTEYMCVQGQGIFDGPSDSASVAAMRAWGVNAVRVPLNESCWLALPGVRAEYAGAAYQRAVLGYVRLLARAGLTPIVELHWTGLGTRSETAQAPMPNRAHSVTLWREIATALRDDPAVILDVFNEPFPDGNRDTPAAWRCWRDGGACPGMAEPAAGMQELVTAIRATGSTHVIALGGVKYANALSGWLAHRPADPLARLVASWHAYNFNACRERACWDATAGAVAREVPLLLGEIGQDDGRRDFVEPLMDWMDRQGGSAGYLAWTWNTWNGSPWRLIEGWDGTPTAYGAIFQERFSR